MRVWLGLGAVLLLAIVVAACAGHDWASPADLWRAIAGEPDLRSRLLADWRLPRLCLRGSGCCIARRRKHARCGGSAWNSARVERARGRGQ